MKASVYGSSRDLHTRLLWFPISSLIFSPTIAHTHCISEAHVRHTHSHRGESWQGFFRLPHFLHDALLTTFRSVGQRGFGTHQHASSGPGGTHGEKGEQEQSPVLWGPGGEASWTKSQMGTPSGMGCTTPFYREKVRSLAGEE